MIKVIDFCQAESTTLFYTFNHITNHLAIKLCNKKWPDVKKKFTEKE